MVLPSPPSKAPHPAGGNAVRVLYDTVRDFLSLLLARLRLDFYPLIQIRLHLFPTKSNFLAAEFGILVSGILTGDRCYSSLALRNVSVPSVVKSRWMVLPVPMMPDSRVFHLLMSVLSSML